MNDCSGANGDKSMDTVTNSSDPPNITTVIRRVYQKLNPDTFIYIPYAIPRNQNPAKIGIVYGNADLNAFLRTSNFVTLSSSSLMFRENPYYSITYHATIQDTKKGLQLKPCNMRYVLLV